MHSNDSKAGPIDLLLDEKRHRLLDMHEYNKRLDRTIILYLTAVYAAIGLRLTGKIDLSSFSNDPEFALIAFLFIFLNYCILLHGISQFAWSISLAKFVHININDELKKMLKTNKQKMPISLEAWDNWTDDIKGVAIISRTLVVGLWIILVMGVSIYSLHVVNVKQFFLINPIVTLISTILLYAFQTCVVFLGVLENYLLGSFHKKSRYIRPPKAKMWILATIISTGILLLCIFFIV